MHNRIDYYFNKCKLINALQKYNETNYINLKKNNKIRSKGTSRNIIERKNSFIASYKQELSSYNC